MMIYLKKQECYDLALLPSIACLGRLRIACRYIFNLRQLRQGVDPLAQWLEHWIFIREDRVSNPMIGGKFFQLCFIPLLWLSCRKTCDLYKNNASILMPKFLSLSSSLVSYDWYVCAPKTKLSCAIISYLIYFLEAGTCDLKKQCLY